MHRAYMDNLGTAPKQPTNRPDPGGHFILDSPRELQNETAELSGQSPHTPDQRLTEPDAQIRLENQDRLHQYQHSASSAVANQPVAGPPMLVGTAVPPPALKTPGLHQLAQRPVEGITHDQGFLPVPLDLPGNLQPATLANSPLPEPPHGRQHPLLGNTHP